MTYFLIVIIIHPGIQVFFAPSLNEIKLSIAGCKVCNLIPMAFLVLEIFYKRVSLLGKIMPSPDYKEVFVIQWKFV